MPAIGRLLTQQKEDFTKSKRETTSCIKKIALHQSSLQNNCCSKVPMHHTLAILFHQRHEGKRALAKPIMTSSEERK